MPHRHSYVSILFIASLLLLSPSAGAGDDSAREQAARAVTQDFLQRLGAALKQEMGGNGPEAAITVCRDLAPRIAGELSRANGWQVTRVGTRVRNPMLGLPDAWESGVLEEFARRAAAGAEYPGMSHGEVVAAGERQYYRYMQAIPAQGLCLVCHGDPEQIPAGVRAKLAEDYPHDRATGYRAGDLRGAVSITQPLDIPLLPAGSAE